MQIRCPMCQRPLQVSDTTIDGLGDFLLGKEWCVECPDCGLVEVPSASADTQSMPQDDADPLRRKVGRFRLIRMIGEGGFGQVWRARDLQLERDIALKLPRMDRMQTSSLKYEAQAAARLRHPNIVAVHEVGEFEGQVYIASELIEGINLRDLIRSRRPAEKRTVEMLGNVARALHYAHEQGVIHRDVKPANILIDADGRPHVTDFGLAKRLQADMTITEEGEVIGTARYMSPEQAAGRTRQTDHRTDVYAVGVMLFEMLTGTYPFTGSVEAILYQKVHEDPPSPRTRAPKLNRDLETICLRALERDPDKRYPSALALAEELQRYAAGEPIHARPISQLERGWRWCKRRPDVAGLLAGLFLALTVGLFVSEFFWMRAEANHRLAQANFHQAEEQRKIADARSNLLRRSLYRARMNQAAVLLDAGDYAGLRQSLDELAADALMAPLMGFEADYFAAQSNPLQPIANHGAVVRGVAVSPNGSLCASIGLDPQHHIRVWDVRSGSLVRELGPADVPVDTVAFAPASGRLASGSRDGVVRLWDPRRDAAPIAEANAGGQVRKIRFSPDGRWLVACGLRGGLWVFHADDLAPADEFPGGPSIQDVQFTPDGDRLIAIVNDDQMRTWHLGSEQPQPPVSVPAGIRTFAISPDGAQLIAGMYTSKLWRYWLDGSREPETIDVDWGRIDHVEFHRESQMLLVSASDGQLHWYDLTQDRELRQVQTHEFGVGVVAQSAGGKALVVGTGDGSVSLIALDGPPRVEILWHEAPVREAAYLPGGAELLTIDNDARLTRWRLADGAARRIEVSGVDAPRTLAVDPAGGFVAVAGDAAVVAVCDPNTLLPQNMLTVKSPRVSHVRCSPDGTLLAVGGGDGAVSVYRAGEWNRPVVQLPPGGSPLTALALSEAAPHLAAAWEDGRAALLEAAPNAAPRELSALPARCTALAFCRENQLVLGTESGDFLFWDVKSGGVSKQFKGHSGRIRAITPLPDGRRILTAGFDRTVRLWDPATGERITRFRGTGGQVFTIAAAPDGRSVACGLITGEVRFLHAPARPPSLAVTAAGGR